MMYIDPSAGSMVFQVIVASMLGGLVAFRKTVFDFFRRFLPKKNKDA